MIRLSGAGRLAVMLALLAGCSTGLKTDGPFGRSSTSRIATQCFPVRHNGVGTFGGLSFGNNGGPARIDKVTLVNARHLRIVAAWVVPVTGDDLLGVFDGFPPDGTGGFPGPPPEGVHWAERQRAEGATIPHMPGQSTINLVLVLKPSGRQGTASTEDVYYQSGGTHYLLDLAVAIQVRNDQRSC